jgi:hypothetical protein
MIYVLLFYFAGFIYGLLQISAAAHTFDLILFYTKLE